MSKIKPQERLLTIFFRLQAGERLSKAQLSDEYEIDYRTVQRYMSTIKKFFARAAYIKYRDKIRYFR